MLETVDLVVPNIGEFNLRHPALRLDPAVERAFVAVGNKLTDQAVFWSDGPRVLVLPAGLDRLWFADVHEVLGVDEPTVVSPAPRTGRLIHDLLHDGPALAKLRVALAGRRVRMLVWGATPEVYQLAATVRGWDLDVELDGPSEEDYWSSLYLDSKLSCADLAARVPGMALPGGITVTTWEELRGAVRAVLAGGTPAIVKSGYGVGGEGSTVVRSGQADLDGFWLAVNRDPFLRTFPLVVQPYLPHADNMGCPALDLRVTDDGVSDVTLSAMTVDVNRFRAVSVGDASVPAHLADRLRDLGTAVGLAARDLGYRGWLCIDCLVDGDGGLYVTEFNARRSGAMHSIALLARWTGGSADTLVTHSDDSVPVRPPRGRASYAQHVRPVFERLWAEGVRAFPTSVRGLGQPRQDLAALAAGPSAEAAVAVVAGVRAATYHKS